MKHFSKFAAMAMALCVVAGLSSCKSNESIYKKAYEKAQAQTEVAAAPQQQVVQVQQPAPVKVTTVTNNASTVDTSNEPVRSEKVQVISGAGLKAYSVVCGSFSLKSNAEGLQKQLQQKGYEAQIVLNPERKLYRVVASTFNDKASAVQSRNTLRQSYSDAWLLYNN